MGEVTSVYENLETYKPWTSYNQSFINTSIVEEEREFFTDEIETYEEGEWSHEIVDGKVSTHED